MPNRYFTRNFLILSLALLIYACKSSNLLEAPSTSNKAVLTNGSQGDSLELTSGSDHLQVLREKEMGIREYQPSRTRDFDLIHTALKLEFDYTGRRVLGQAVLEVIPFFYNQEVLILDAKDFEVHDTWLAEDRDTVRLAFEYDQKKLGLLLPKIYGRKDTLHIGVNYTANPGVGTGPGSTAISDTKGLYFINPLGGKPNKPIQIWTQGETTHNSKWFPTIDSPNERHTHDIELKVDQKYRTLSNGELINQTYHKDGDRTDHWRMELSHAPYLSAIVIGEFEEIEDKFGDIPVNYYVEEGYKAGAAKVFEHTPEMMGFFAELLGVEFPWPKYDQVVVRDFVSGAMENTTISIFMEGLNLNEREAIDSEWDYIIAHELFHQWFGNYVTTESWSNLPLNESFADYSEYLWIAHKEGIDRADIHHFNAMEQYLDEAREKQVDLVRFYYDDQEDMFDSHSYAKGGRILHMLRRHLGDEAFFASLNHYLTKNAFSSVEVHDLRMSFEEITGMDLNWFFNQWFLDSGHPLLEITWDTQDPDNLLLGVRQKQNLENTPLYQIPFTVSIYKGGKKTEKEFTLTSGFQQFAIENGSGTDLVIFDENRVILAERQTFRGKEGMLSQFQWAESGLARLEALDSLTGQFNAEIDFSLLLIDALEDPFYVVRELALNQLSRERKPSLWTPTVEDKILYLAENDSENSVRAMAIEVLSGYASVKFEKLFYRLINAPSYQVAGAALTAFMDLDGNETQKEEIFQRLREEENIRILVALADFLTETKNQDEAEWFHSKIRTLNGESLYYFIGYYADYFASVGELPHATAVKILNGLAKEHAANYVRLAAFQSLFGFIEEEGVLEMAESLWKEETDDTIKGYQFYYLEPYLDGY